MKRNCHMKIPHFVFHKMEKEFGELRPLFLKFAHSYIDIIDVQNIIAKVDSDLASNELKPNSEPFTDEKYVKSAINEVCRSTAGDKKLEEIREIYWKSCANCKDAFLEAVKGRCDAELDPDFDSSWRDYTAVYPDKFDGDNISIGNFHSCKFKDINSVDDEPVWDKGHVCHSIQALTWRIAGLYKEFCMEPDVLVSEQSKVTMVQDLIRLSHYVLDSSTIVHLMKTSSHFHTNFEEDLDDVVEKILPEVEIKINRKIFQNDSYGEADKRAQATFKKFYFRILELYGEDARNNSQAKKVFTKGNGLGLAKEIISNACQNLADFWNYTFKICKVEKAMDEFVEANDLDHST